MSKLRGMVLGSFVGDALALGPHWIYNVDEIKTKFGRIEGLTAPATQYHASKGKGDFTHYGDLALMSFRYLKLNSEVEKTSYYQCYQSFLNGYEGYRDHATSTTLDNLNNDLECGSHISELGGAATLASVVYTHPNNKELGLSEAELLISLTHNSDVLIERSKFLAEILYRVLKGDTPVKSILALKKTASKKIYDDIVNVQTMLDLPTERAIKQLGQSCDSDYAFPAVLYFVMKYEDEFDQALLQNIYGGGDSAARGMTIGAILGAYHGESKIPVAWLTEMNHLKKIENLLMT